MGLFCRRGREQRCGGLCGCGGVPTESLAAASVLGLSPEGGGAEPPRGFPALREPGGELLRGRYRLGCNTS